MEHAQPVLPTRLREAPLSELAQMPASADVEPLLQIALFPLSRRASNNILFRKLQPSRKVTGGSYVDVLCRLLERSELGNRSVQLRIIDPQLELNAIYHITCHQFLLKGAKRIESMITRAAV